MEVKARYQSKQHSNQSLHYFNSYAVKDRASAKGLSNVRPRKLIDELQLEEFLPTATVQEDIIADVAHIVPRVIVHHLKPYKEFKKAVVYHIPHEHTTEMSKNSEIVRKNILSIFITFNRQCTPMHPTLVFLLTVCQAILFCEGAALPFSKFMISVKD